jgi:hypothetical protein
LFAFGFHYPDKTLHMMSFQKQVCAVCCQWICYADAGQVEPCLHFFCFSCLCKFVSCPSCEKTITSKNKLHIKEKQECNDVVPFLDSKALQSGQHSSRFVLDAKSSIFSPRFEPKRYVIVTCSPRIANELVSHIPHSTQNLDLFVRNKFDVLIYTGPPRGFVEPVYLHSWERGKAKEWLQLKVIVLVYERGLDRADLLHLNSVERLFLVQSNEITLPAYRIFNMIRYIFTVEMQEQIVFCLNHSTKMWPTSTSITVQIQNDLLFVNVGPQRCCCFHLLDPELQTTFNKERVLLVDERQLLRSFVFLPLFLIMY